VTRPKQARVERTQGKTSSLNAIVKIPCSLFECLTSDENGYRKDVMEAVKQMGVSILRWPGENFASGYTGKTGSGLSISVQHGPSRSEFGQ
jgi:hypothetical protein